MKLENKKGFTLIEVLLVIAILAILAAIVIIAVNPGKQLATARDGVRLADVNTILNAIHQYSLDNEGLLPGGISTTTGALEICRTESVICTDLYDLSEITDDEVYLLTFPHDPRCPYDGAYCADNGIGYYVSQTPGGRINVFAPGAEIYDEISVTK